MAIAACLLAALVGLAVAWAQPRPMSDYFLALAGGRDVIDGKLGQPDDWSFLTQGRVWIQQNWGADAIFYLVQHGLGDGGILALKALLLVLAAGAALAGARARGTGWAASLMVLALALASWPAAAVIRASLFSFVFTPLLLWMLHRSLTVPRWILAAPLLLLVWANVHGSFMFGLGMLWLWAGCRVAAEIPARGPGGALRGQAAPAAAALAATAAAALVNPFGVRNVITPFSVGPQSAWNQVYEWQPIFGGSEASVNPWAFTAFAALLVLLGAGGLRGAGRKRSPEATALAAFETILTVVLLVLAFRSRRFALLAALTLTPVLARRIQGVLRPSLLLATGLILVFAGLASSVGITAHYLSPDDPRDPPATFLDKMVGTYVAFPAGAATFLAENHVRGRMFQEYRWESYLHWRCPDLALFLGGRAQQIYTEADRAQRSRLTSSHDPSSVLRSWGVDLVAVPLLPEFAPFASALLHATETRWVYVYIDHLGMVLACLDTETGSALAAQVADSSLAYPDEPTALLSRGMYLASPASQGGAAETYRALRAALEQRPVFFAYAPLAQRALTAGIPNDELAGFLLEQQARVQTEFAAHPERTDLKECLDTLAAMIHRN